MKLFTISIFRLFKGVVNLRILHTSDWHLGKMLENVNRLEEQRQFIDQLCDVAESEKIDAVLVAGDIYDTYNPSAAAEELFYEAIDRLSNRGSRAVVIIAGNHDSPERLCAATPLANKNGIILLGYPGSDPGILKSESGGVAVVRSGMGWFELNVRGCEHNAVIATLPYPSETRLDQLLADEADEEKIQMAYSDKVKEIFARLSQNFRKDTVNLVVGHLFMRGGKESESERVLQVGGAMTVSPDALPPNAHYAALGHLHRPQQIKDASCPAYYSGSPLAYSFSEADYSKALYIVEAKPGCDAKIEEIYLSCGKPLRRWEAKNGIEQAIRWCEEGRDCNAWIDLEVYTDRPIMTEEQKRLRELNPGIINIRPRILNVIDEEADIKNRETRRIDELFIDYYRYKTGMEISEELLNVFLEVLNERDENDAMEDNAVDITEETSA